MNANWLKDARGRYQACNRSTLEWVLDRAPMKTGFLNTKVDPLTGADYGDQSGYRAPGFTYGWIQGRGLEALTTFAAYYTKVDTAFATRLAERARTQYLALANLWQRDRHIYFLYDHDMTPIRATGSTPTNQVSAGDIYTYSDAFAAKGLVAGSLAFESSQTGASLEYLKEIISAIEDDRFQLDESIEPSSENIAGQNDDFGPKMILLGAAGVLHRAGRSDETAFADRFIDDVLDRYFDPTSGLLLNVPGHDRCNVGHGIEFCGFAFEHLAHQPGDPRIPLLGSILRRSLEVGLQGPGIALYLSAKSGEAVSPYYPWWPMPEAVRACALGTKLGADNDLPALWQRADRAFFDNYWRDDQSFAFQTRDLNGPVDFVPATPDLDPAYHTCLSFLAAIETIDASDDHLT